MTRAFVSWSGGKDSMLALHRAREQGIQVECLLAMMDETGDRSRSHGVPPALLQAQADALGLPLVTAAAGWSDYEAVFTDHLQRFAACGLTHGVFGDIDLQPHRDWEERVCAAAGLQALLPLWEQPREALAREVLALGYRARVVCVDGRWLDAGYAGRLYDEAFLADLPPGVDACGENGEFHTFVFDGPLFRAPVAHAVAAVHTLHLQSPAPATYHLCDLVCA